MWTPVPWPSLEMTCVRGALHSCAMLALFKLELGYTIPALWRAAEPFVEAACNTTCEQHTTPPPPPPPPPPPQQPMPGCSVGTACCFTGEGQEPHGTCHVFDHDAHACNTTACQCAPAVNPTSTLLLDRELGGGLGQTRWSGAGADVSDLDAWAAAPEWAARLQSWARTVAKGDGRALGASAAAAAVAALRQVQAHAAHPDGAALHDALAPLGLLGADASSPTALPPLNGECGKACVVLADEVGRTLFSEASIPSSDVNVSLGFWGLEAMYCFCIGALVSITLSAVLDQLDDWLRPRLLRGRAERSTRAAPDWVPAADEPTGGLDARFIAPTSNGAPATGLPPVAALNGMRRDEELTPNPSRWEPMRLSEPLPSPGHVSERGTLLLHIVLVLAQLVAVMGTFLLPNFRRTVGGVLGQIFSEVGISFDTDVNFVEMTILVSLTTPALPLAAACGVPCAVRDVLRG
jgi:hypothetical protein